MRFPKPRFFWLALFSAFGAWYWRKVYRFRDPVRVSPAAPYVSPADGVVSFVRRVEQGAVQGAGVGQLPLPELLGEAPLHADGWLMGIFVGSLDVHYVYAPADGQVEHLDFLPARRGVNGSLLPHMGLLAGGDLLSAKATLHNERYVYSIATPQGQVSVCCISPHSGLQAMSYLQKDAPARKGNKAALIEDGGLVLVHLPAALVPQVSVGERVVGAESVLAVAQS